MVSVPLLKCYQNFGLQSYAKDKCPVSINGADPNMSNQAAQWFLVSNYGANISLPQTMISVGREGCDVILQSRSVDKRHAVVTYDHYEKRFKVKDLNSINGTYLNNARIPSHTFVKVEHLDWLRFGFVVYQIQVVDRIPASVPSGPEYPYQQYGNWVPARQQFPPQQQQHHAPMKMAECQGCLHKQNIQHTCGIKGSEWDVNQQFRTHGVVEPATVSLPATAAAPPPPHTLVSTSRQDLCGNVLTQSSWPMIPVDSNSQKQANHSQNGGNSVSNRCVYGQPQIALITSSQSCECHVPKGGAAYPQGHSNSYASPTIQSQPLYSSVRQHSDLLSLGGFKSPETSGNSLHSNFSGDSLDLRGDSSLNSTSKSMANNEQQSASDSKLNSNGLDSKSDELNVMKAEKPYVVDITAPSSCSQSADSTEDASDGGKACRQSCTAFTIEFDDGSAAAKKLDIKDSISKFAPPKMETSEIKSSGHRRNLSLSKVDELQVLENFSDENGNTDKRRQSLDCEENSKTLIDTVSEMSDSSAHVPVRSARLRLAGYMSEGHLSSDQDDDASAKSDPAKKGGRVSQGSELVSVDAHAKRSLAPGFVGSKQASVAKLAAEAEKISKNGGANVRHSLPSAVGDSAKYLINKMFGAVTAPPTSPTDPVKAIVATSRCEGPSDVTLTKNDTKTGSHSSLMSTATYLVNNVANGKSHATLRTTTEQQEDAKELYLSEEDVEDDNLDDDDLEEDDEDGVCDDVSESGTYTIEKDDKDAAEVEARQKIDCVFGVSAEEKHVSDNIDDDTEFEGVELRRKTPESAESRGSTASRKATPSWLKEWVAQTADQARATLRPAAESVNSRETAANVARVLPTTHSSRPVSVPVSASPDVPPRPRRKLPVLPVDKGTRTLILSSSPLIESLVSSPLDRMVSPSLKEKPKTSNGSSRASPDGRRSDSSMDTETILKDTETVVSAMEARIDKRASRQKGPIVTISSLESRDSGGESDLDTSTASPVNENCHHMSKKLSAQLKAQLRVLDDANRSGSISAKSVRSSASSGIHLSTKDGGSSSSHGHSTPTGDYADNVSEVETASIHSDMSSSSDLSASSPGMKRKGGDKPPMMRFNRAFSLRRARLGCDSDGAHSAPVKRVSVGPVGAPSSRPSSVGSVGSGKDRVGANGKRSSTSSKSDSGPSVVSAPNLPPPSSSFSRNDGGRFSLRLPRSAGSPMKPPPIKSASQPKQPAPKAFRVSSASGLSSKTAPNSRSNSTMSAKELEMKNWKRRKEYDPLKAAAEGRKKEAARKSGHGTLLHTAMLSKSESPSPTGMAFQRSASFHGTDGLLRRDTFVSEDYAGVSLEDDEGDSDPNNQSPTYDPLATMYENSDLIYRSRLKKSSEDDSASEATRTMSHTDLASDVMNTSPRGSPSLHPVLRHKSKIDALDNLVISAVHQLSCNLRGTTENILRKVSELHGPECEQIFGNNGFEEMLSKLSCAESPTSSPQGRTVSKQLAGILKNMKRLEESLQSIDRVMDLVPVVESVSHKLNGGAGEGRRNKVASTATLQHQKQHHNKWNGFNGRDYY